MRGTFYLVSDPKMLEKRLRKKIGFLNVAYTVPERSNEFHSITAFSDGRYVFVRDTNRRHCYVVKSLASLGDLRDSVLYCAVK